MKTKFQKYPKYKDSGIEWLGEIPEGWEVKKVKSIGKVVVGGTPKTDNMSYWENGEISWLPSGMVQNKTLIRDDVYTFITKKGLQESAAKIVKENSVLLAMTGATCGNVALITFPSSFNQSVAGIECNSEIDSRYIYYSLMGANPKILSYRMGGAQSGINKYIVKNLELSMPRYETQLHVADFLDEKTKIIDAMIEKKQKLIELLREKRTSLITRAVTKGLDPNARMKSSGVDWIGEIPEEWEVRRLKFIAFLQYGDSLPNEKRENGEIEVFGSNGPIGFHSKANTKSPVIIVGRKGSFGAINFTEKEVFAIDTTYFIDGRFSKSHLKWLAYSLLVAKLNDISLDTGVPGLSRESVHNKYFPFPTIQVQKQIADFLDHETSKIDKAIELIETQIEKLKEYRALLIFNSVTGKIKI